jgi:hypothetical protein
VFAALGRLIAESAAASPPGHSAPSGGGRAQAEPAVLALTAPPPADETVVPGHLAIAPLLREIIDSQAKASAAERAEWTAAKNHSGSSRYSTATLDGHTIHLIDGRAIVPRGDKGLKEHLLHMAHERACHYTGAERTLISLRDQAKVHWINIDAETAEYVKSCARCQFVKTPPPPAQGTISPTLPPEVHHTWYADFKGPLPHDTGYILIVVEAITRFVKLRYLPKINAKEAIEEFDQVITSFGTAPVVLRTDAGAPFNSKEFQTYCAAEGIKHVVGIPDHSQGQGKVETAIKGNPGSHVP